MAFRVPFLILFACFSAIFATPVDQGIDKRALPTPIAVSTAKSYLSQRARSWTPAQREAYANDLTRPQLVAITDNLNESKGDKDIAQWQPPLASFRCTYARAWVQVKHYYDLTVDSAEKSALEDILDAC
ncbi:hypothetical protein PHLCEN_2v8081 [Hermanssonia centrifuga]|uniref:DUF1524 domain-containing protein n=1 Tax=Hermanssonia centrifuga TaxID=98765 RepID=A0A2R6NUR4_9APHY|nr:hypothetical protein PHLCEN_2v8081 [Hermanssonia centrifuga]